MSNNNGGFFMWYNFFHEGKFQELKSGHIQAEELIKKIKSVPNKEIYHGIFDLEKRQSFVKYKGNMRPALGVHIIDFDHDESGGEMARQDVIKFIEEFEIKDYSIFFSGSKGFHLYINESLMALRNGDKLSDNFKIVLKHLKRQFPTVDDKVYCAAHKIRAPFSKHPKTGLYKVLITEDLLYDSMAEIIAFAKARQTPCDFIPAACDPNPYIIGNISIDSPEVVNEKRLGRHVVLRRYIIKQSDFVSNIEDLVLSVNEFEQEMNDPKGSYFDSRDFLKGKSRLEAITVFVESLVEWKKKKKAWLGETWDLGQSKEYPTKASGFYKIVPKLNSKNEEIKLNGELVTKEVPDHYGLAEYVLKELNLVTNDSQMFFYNKTHYECLGPLAVKKLIIGLTKQKADSVQVNKFYDSIKSYNFIGRLPQNTDGFLNLRNGILDVNRRAIQPHNPDFFFKYCIDVDYDPDAKCPEWLKFLNDTFQGNKELCDVSAEILGYCMVGGKPWLHKAFFLIGEGRNGKSVYLAVFYHILGKQNTSSVSIQNFDKPFSAVSVDGKLANIIGETTVDEINSETFKTAVGGEFVTAAQKYMAEYDMEFRARIISACNKFPYFKDTTSGNYEKLFFIPFDRFLKKKNRDPMYAEKFLFPEASGIINWALDGLNRLVERGMLPEIEAINQKLDEYRTESDTVFDWVSRHMTFDADHEQSFMVKHFYSHYRGFCEQHHRTPTSLIGFSRKVMNELRKRDVVILLSSANLLKVTRGVKISIKPNYSDYL